MTYRIATSADVPIAAAEIRGASRVAVDTEFHAERRYTPRLYLVQVHVTDGRTWVLDPLERGVLQGVGDALLSVPWVVHGGSQDMRLLNEALGGLPDEILDTQIGAAFLDNRFPRAYVDLIADHLGREIEKAATLSDWSRRPLSARQLEYAVEDVQLLPPLWERISAQLVDRGRLELAHAACAEARQAIRDPAPFDLAWREIPAGASLDPQQSAVLQELAAWREEVAQRLDQPPRAIISDAILVQISRQQPLTLASLENRRTPRGFVKTHGEAVLERVARAARRPAWAWPTPIRTGSAHARSVAWLQSWAEHEGHARGWSPRLVLPRQTLEDLVVAAPADRHGLAARIGAWRDALCGDALWEALQGRVGLSLHGGDTVASPVIDEH